MVKLFKIITTILLSLVYILGIFISCVMLWVPKFDAFIGGILFILVLYYVNWAIWTKGKVKKIIMAFVVISFFVLFCMIISYE